DRRAHGRALLQRVRRELARRGLPRDRIAGEVPSRHPRVHRLPGSPPRLPDPRGSAALRRDRSGRRALSEGAVKITFAHPELVPLFLAALAVLALAALTLVRRRRAAAAFGGAGAPLISASPARQVAKLALLAVALLATVAALVGPQIGEAPRRGATATVDTVIALDVSQSMAVTDVAPDRLRGAQQAIQQIAQHVAGGRAGLSLFAGSGTSR